jgi:excisionase family DNA binding protein
MVARRRPSGKVDQRKGRDAESLLDGTTGPAPDRDRLAGFDANCRLLTVAEAADICKISERQLRRMIKDNRIRVVRFGRAVRIRPADLGI